MVPFVILKATYVIVDYINLLKQCAYFGPLASTLRARMFHAVSSVQTAITSLHYYIINRLDIVKGAVRV